MKLSSRRQINSRIIFVDFSRYKHYYEGTSNSSTSMCNYDLQFDSNDQTHMRYLCMMFILVLVMCHLPFEQNDLVDVDGQHLKHPKANHQILFVENLKTLDKFLLDCS